ncbi:MAG TPA: hypothetical protein PLX20_10290 [Rhodocyclaceae bacterium]|nr:hypothetical protein [Rhodocyclaceae bacterium]HMV54793.1 hypothetical protein [Rhodocyclaceae bacterium]HMZ83780.1 hypothetical protein [Rhodocyclaceae bacterium]HNA04344.1 hypothetical protein [Rhodocyclaceae bacterium]HNB78807.1 hypothetical protein [Rhodocyclaceae bacterium]
MRAFRDSLTVCRLAASAAACIVAASPAFADAMPPVDAGGNAYYPLSVGNTWTYRCGAEGSSAFEKTVKLTAVVDHDGKRYYRAEMRLKRDPKPLIAYLSTGGSGEVFSVFKVGEGPGEVLVTSAPKTGDRVGERIAVAGEKTRVPALGAVSVVRVENFGRDDPKIPADQRMEWSGRYYASGVGLVAEADGLGGECVLTRYKVGAKR